MKKADGRLRSRQQHLVELALQFNEQTKKINISPMLGFGNLLGAIRHKGFIPWDDDFDFLISRKDFNELLSFSNEDLYFSKYYGSNEEECIKKWYKDQIISHSNNLILLQTPRITRVFFPYKKYEEALFLDLYVLDSLNASYTRDVHRERISLVGRGLSLCRTCEEEYKLLDYEVEKLVDCYSGDSAVIYGLDCCENYNPIWKHELMFYYNDIFPMVELEFEGSSFKAPANPEKYLVELYGPNYMKLPKNCALHIHDNYIQ